jgi:hypothetical protein
MRRLDDPGKHGTTHTWGNGKTWVLYVHCRSVRQWSAVKMRLSFCQPTQDGDEEGCLRLHHLPTFEQAAVIRDVVGVQKRREYSEETRERLRAMVASWNGAEPRQNSSIEAISRANDPGPVPDTGEDETPILDAELAT